MERKANHGCPDWLTGWLTHGKRRRKGKTTTGRWSTSASISPLDQNDSAEHTVWGVCDVVCMCVCGDSFHS